MANPPIPNNSSFAASLGKLETFALLAATMLAITVEAACVFWLGRGGAMHPSTSPALVGQWTAATLPQFWLLGAVVVLLWRLSIILYSSQSLHPGELARHRRAFLRLWACVVAVGAVQISALYLDRVVLGVH